MRFLHISDLHLGKRVHEFSMLAEQSHILQVIVELAKENKVDAVLISGDIYDKTQPPAEAVELFDSFLTELFTADIAVLAISGNHDAQERISYGNKILSESNVHFSHTFDGSIKSIPFQDEYGTLWVHLLPFLKPLYVRRFFEGVQAGDYSGAIEAVLGNLDLKEADRHVLLAHQFVVAEGKSPERSESELQMVGGLDSVKASLFSSFDYVALGHLHKAQEAGANYLRYSGSPLKYSFSEIDHEKSAVLIELREKGKLKIELLPLYAKHDLRYIEGFMDELLDPDFIKEQKKDDYLFVGIKDEQVVDAMAKLRGVYPNVMSLEFISQKTGGASMSRSFDPQLMESPLQLFEQLYFRQWDKEMSPESKELITKFIIGEEQK